MREMIEKLEAQAASESALGNHAAAASFAEKASRLRLKYNLPALAPEPVKSVLIVEVKPQKYSENFPGVPPADGPLTNEQLASLRAKAASVGGRPLTDKELASVLGVEYSEPKRGDKCNYFEV
jgi:hypothetical protein